MNKRLFVAGLPFSSTSDDLKAHFSSVGVVVSAQVITDKFTGRSKGFGFVEFEIEEDAKNAITTFNDTDFGGRKLIVAEAKALEKREKPSFSNKGTGNFRNRFQNRGRSSNRRGRESFKNDR